MTRLVLSEMDSVDFVYDDIHEEVLTINFIEGKYRVDINERFKKEVKIDYFAID